MKALVSLCICFIPGPVVLSVMSLAVDPGIASSILARSHTFMEIDREIISKVILLLPLIKEDCCHFQAKVCVNRLVKIAQKKSVVR